MRKAFLLALVVLLCFAVLHAQKAERAAQNPLAGIPTGLTRVVDLSYALGDKVVTWPGSEQSFAAETVSTLEKDGIFLRSFRVLEHFGTHLDAPAHFIAGQSTVDQIPPAKLFGPAVVIDVQAEAAKNADYRLTVADIEQWESKNGRIPAGAIVLLRTGWAARWPNVQRYRNPDAQRIMHFPGFSVEAVHVLIARKVSGLGIDTLSIDYGPSQQFEAHKVSLAAGLYHLENVADMNPLPMAGAWMVVAPIKLEGGSGGPVRVFAILP